MTPFGVKQLKAISNKYLPPQQLNFDRGKPHDLMAKCHFGHFLLVINIDFKLFPYPFTQSKIACQMVRAQNKAGWRETTSKNTKSQLLSFQLF